MSLVHARVLFERAELARARGETAEVHRRLRVLRRWIAHNVPGQVPYLVTHADAVQAELARDLGDPSATKLLTAVADSYRQQGATACQARLATSLWLYGEARHRVGSFLAAGGKATGSSSGDCRVPTPRTTTLCTSSSLPG